MAKIEALNLLTSVSICDNIVLETISSVMGVKTMAFIKSFNNQSLGEEIANGVSHCVGALLGIAGTAVLIVIAAFRSSALGVVSAALYGASLILTYCMSTLYHALTNEKAKKVFQILDHCSIYLLIVGSYIPISLVMIAGLRHMPALGWTIFGINAACMIIGIVLNSINLKKYKKISLILDIIMGWLIVFSIKYVFDICGIGGMYFLVSGGLCYTIGIIFYKLKKVKYMHFIWHLFVLAGSILHYFFILFYCYPKL